jgi:hypothetical protein
MNNVLGSLILIAALIACSSVKKTDEHTGESHPPAQTALPDSIYRFTVSFISIGSGIDHKAREEFMGFIKQFGEQNSVTIRTEKSSWGREGESDYCMKLEELTSEQQEQFITATKDILKNSKRVRYRENSICRAGRRSDTK